jgi:hypothetical protein
MCLDISDTVCLLSRDKNKSFVNDVTVNPLRDRQWFLPDRLRGKKVHYWNKLLVSTARENDFVADLTFFFRL